MSVRGCATCRLPQPGAAAARLRPRAAASWGAMTDDLDTLTTTLMNAAMRLASSMVYQVCASHEKKRLVSLGQQHRQRQWWQELLGADSIPAAMTHPQDDLDIIFRRRSHSESYCVVRCTWLILAAAAFREPLTPSAAHSTQRAPTSGDHEQRRVVVDKCAGIPAKIFRLPSRLGPGRVAGREERPLCRCFRTNDPHRGVRSIKM